MNKWFKLSVSLVLIGIATITLDLIYNYQINYFFNQFRIYWVGLAILFAGCLIIVLAYFAFLMGAKPVLDKELLGKEA